MAVKGQKTCPLRIVVLAGLVAVAMVSRVAGASSERLSSLSPEVESLYASGLYSRAAELLEAAVQRDSKNGSLYYWLGRCYFESRDFDHSISSWERAVALDSDRSDHHDWLGRAYGRKAEQDSHTKMASALALARKTHREFETAVQLDARDIQAQRDLIDFMASAPKDLGGGEDLTLEQIRTLSSIDPLAGTLALADFYATRKKFDLAGQEYQQILKSAPNRIDPYFEIADYYRDRDDSEHMQQAVEGALKVSGADRRLDYYLGVSLVLAKIDSETAEKDLRSYIKTVPENSELPSHSSAYEYLGKLYENQGRSDMAVEQYQAALALDPQNKSVRETLKKLQKK
jgi:tetratricopeptide (TPR) repeat protein